MDFARNPPIPVFIGFNVNIPLRIFDRNQGEKLHTQLDITHNERLRDANIAQVFSDVDSAYATLDSNLILLRPYKANTCSRPWRCAIRFLSPISMAARRCSISCKPSRTTAVSNSAI